MRKIEIGFMSFYLCVFCCDSLENGAKINSSKSGSRNEQTLRSYFLNFHFLEGACIFGYYLNSPF